jgi:hypothetical protein
MYIKPFSKNSLVLPFANSDEVDGYYSQQAQDLFVLSCLNGKENGVYLDLGCNLPERINNTYLLESKFNWTGLSVDVDKNCTDAFKTRKSKVLCQDATTLDYNTVINLVGTNKIDYLSLDLEPADITYKCLENIPFNSVEFSVITYEHDFYRFGDTYRANSRALLKSKGYEILCVDVTSDEGCIYEDWYYNPKYIDSKYVEPLKRDNVSGKQIVLK